MALREFSTVEESADFLGVSIAQMREWADNHVGPNITTTANPRCYLRRDLNLFKRKLLSQPRL